ncbi:MAG: hypothetical protein R3275_03415, partial [Saprospiraceae bacterium]|nr:hypothetical protein [Saprospiraceae bacterium]
MRFTRIAILLVLLILVDGLNAQYFGRNKPRYHQFDFEVLNTPHFAIHNYLENKEKLYEVAEWCEDWYHLHQAVLLDTFKKRNPFILYNDHPDFQQTNTISGRIGAGTGGVTEAFKNRVVLPFAFTNQQTHHVIGHELVHAFQYNMILNADTTSFENLGNLPLWMVEGLAEYLSIGRYDSHTAMWMRDAVYSEDIPSFDDLNNPRYFPYRYGQVFWSFMTGMYGDDVIRPLYLNTAIHGLNVTIDSLLGVHHDTLSNNWKRTIKKYYKPMLAERAEFKPGESVIDKDNAGYINVSPVISPSGRFVIFLSEKDLFTTDLFLYDLRQEKIVEKLTSTTRDGHLDDIAYFESSGSWSRNGNEFIFVAYKQGRHYLIIKDVETGKTTREIKIPGVPAISNPCWSPQGNEIVFSGLVEGQTDLYKYDLRTKELTQLTNDRYSEIHPNWNLEGDKIVYATDRLSMDRGRTHGKWKFNLAIMDMETSDIDNIDVFPGADNLNPLFDHEDQIIFLSDRDGFRNIYRYDQDSQYVYQLTDILTGISGITRYSPAVTVSQRRDRILYTVYEDHKYAIYESQIGDMMKKRIDPKAVDHEAAILPFNNERVDEIVNENISKLGRIVTTDTALFEKDSYRPKFKLDAIFGSGIGVGVGTGTFGTQTGIAGGVNLLFSDMLGNNQLYTSASLNGELIDFGGLVSYLNRKNRIAWGVNLSHIPFRTGSFRVGTGTVDIDGQMVEAIIEETDILRIFEEQLSVFAQYPLSTTQRFELGAGVNYRFFRRDQYRDYYDIRTGFFIGSERDRVDIGDRVFLGNYVIEKGVFYSLNAAYVGDNSFFGVAAPLAGYRWRVSADHFFGGYDVTSINLDGRYYHRMNPVTFAFRAQHYSQFTDDDFQTFPILIGNGQWGLVRGFDYNQLQENFERYGLTFDQLSGSKFGVVGFEVRLPFTGPRRLALIPSKFLFTDLNLFVDAGIAFDDYEEIFIKPGEPGYNTKSALVASAGLSLRVNL